MHSLAHSAAAILPKTTSIENTHIPPSSAVTMNNPTDFFSLLDDPVLAQLTKTARPQPAPVKPSTTSAVTANDWLLFSPSSIVAPHPDLFESDIDNLLGTFETDLSALSAFPLDFDVSNHNFSQYRSPAAGNSTYSGYGPSTLTTSSESLSAYGSTYDQYEAYAASSTTGSHLGPTNSASLATLFPELDFSGLGLAAADDQTNMLNHHLSLDTDQDIKAFQSSSAYDSASPSYDSASHPGSVSPTYYPISAGSASAPSYLAPSSRSDARSTHSSPGTAPSNVPSNANSALISRGLVSETEPQSEADPRKKYQCSSCPRAFARAFNLKTHMATHDPLRVKNFKCRHAGCGRSFSRKHDLGRHLVSIHQDHSVAGSTTVAAASGSATRTPVGPKTATAGGPDRNKICRHSCECSSDDHNDVH